MQRLLTMGYYKIQIKLHAFLFREERIRAQLELDPKKPKIQKYKHLCIEQLELTPEPLDSRATGQSISVTLTCTYTACL